MSRPTGDREAPKYSGHILVIFVAQHPAHYLAYNKYLKTVYWLNNWIELDDNSK